jgi:hypothetical protein
MAIVLDTATLEAALAGYRHRLAAIETIMADLRRKVGGNSSRPAKSTGTMAEPSAPEVPRRRRRRLSAEGRARIVAAQRARWARSRKSAKA